MSRTDSPSPAAVQFSVEITEDPGRLAAIVAEWEELATLALEPNPMYEHWMLLPAIRLAPAEQRPICLLVWMRDKERPAAPAKLAALVPLQRIRQFRAIPASALATWTHRSWRLGTPLVRADQARACLAVLLDWLEDGGDRSSVLELRSLPAEGAFCGVLADALRERRSMVIAGRELTRPVLRRAPSAEAYLEHALSAVGYRSLRRKEKRLARRGAVGKVALPAGEDAWRWIDDFLRLDAGGWKSRQAAALATTRNELLFAYQTLSAAHKRNRLDMVGIDLDGQAIARTCSIRAGEGAFAFRTAYDELYRAHSPAVMAEVDAIRYLHGVPSVQWVDSIGTADDITRKRVWAERRTVRTLVVGAGTWGELWVSMLPVMHWTRRRVAAAGSVLARYMRAPAELHASS